MALLFSPGGCCLWRTQYNLRSITLTWICTFPLIHGSWVLERKEHIKTLQHLWFGAQGHKQQVSELNHYVERSLLVSVCVYRSCLHLCLIVCVGVWANVHMLVWVLECTVCHKGYNKSSGAKGNVTHQLCSLLSTQLLTLLPKETSIHCCIPNKSNARHRFLCFLWKNNPNERWQPQMKLSRICASAV